MRSCCVNTSTDPLTHRTKLFGRAPAKLSWTTSLRSSSTVFFADQGAQPHVRFDPPMLEMGPVLPHAPEGHLREVTILNEGSWDVEIFSLDFDKVNGRKDNV